MILPGGRSGMKSFFALLSLFFMNLGLGMDPDGTPSTDLGPGMDPNG
jgi:hypothetical protein